MNRQTMTGWWSAEGELTREIADQLRDELVTARDAGKEVVVVEGVTLRWHPAPDSIDAAWAAAEAALPEGWDGPRIGPLYVLDEGSHPFGPAHRVPGRFAARAITPENNAYIEGDGDTPADALRSLVDRIAAATLAPRPSELATPGTE